jgi:hypothetical protein
MTINRVAEGTSASRDRPLRNGHDINTLEWAVCGQTKHVLGARLCLAPMTGSSAHRTILSHPWTWLWSLFRLQRLGYNLTGSSAHRTILSHPWTWGYEVCFGFSVWAIISSGTCPPTNCSTIMWFSVFCTGATWRCGSYLWARHCGFISAKLHHHWGVWQCWTQYILEDECGGPIAWSPRSLDLTLINIFSVGTPKKALFFSLLQDCGRSLGKTSSGCKQVDANTLRCIRENSIGRTAVCHAMVVREFVTL